MTAPPRFAFYPATSFLRPKQDLLTQHYAATLDAARSSGTLATDAEFPSVHYRKLDWDSSHFQLPVFRIDALSLESYSAAEIAQHLSRFRSKMLEGHRRAYCFSEVPSEDLRAIAALSRGGFALIETRLTYWRDDVQRYAPAHRYPVRAAGTLDIANLREVAASARNDFDRFHADPFWNGAEADSYLAQFVENSVRGFADVTLVPESVPGEAGAFLTGNFDREVSALVGQNVARMVLSAVGPNRRGSYVKLISELACWFQDRGVDVIYLTTQSTNRAVIRVWEKLGFRYGRASHIFSTSVSP